MRPPLLPVDIWVGRHVRIPACLADPFARAGAQELGLLTGLKAARTPAGDLTIVAVVALDSTLPGRRVLCCPSALGGLPHLRGVRLGPA